MLEPLVDRALYLDRLMPWLGKPVIKVICGMRRIGKSTILKLLARRAEAAGRECLSYDMESLQHEELRAYRPFYDRVKQDLGGRQKLLLVDEVQMIEGWQKALGSLLAEGSADIVITGSNASILSGELATLLAGRAVSFEVHPLTLPEFETFSRGEPTDSEERFSAYLRQGGLPGIHAIGSDEGRRFQYLDAVFSAIALKDIVARIGIRDIDLFNRLVRFAFDNIGNLLSVKSISDFIKSERRGASVDTIAGYLEGLERAFVLKRVPRWDVKGKRQLQIAEKYYAGDIGLRHAVAGWRDGDIGAVIENLVYLELARRGYKVSVGKIDNLEIDFIAERDGSSIYIQAAYLLDSPTTIERELAPFRKLLDRSPSRLITLDRVQGRDFEGVRRLDLRDFLRGAEL